MKSGKNGHFVKAVVRQNRQKLPIYLEDEFRRSRIMQKLTLNTHRDVLWEKQLEKLLVSILKTAKIGHFAKAIASQNGQKRSLLSLNF